MTTVGTLNTPYSRNADGTYAFQLGASHTEAELRAEWTVTNAEVKRIQGEGPDLTTDQATRLLVLQSYKAALRRAVEEIVAARQAVSALDSGDLPDPAAATVIEPAAPAAAPEPVAEPVAEPEPVLASATVAEPAAFTVDGDEVIDRDGRRFRLVRPDAPVNPGALSADQVAAMAAQVRDGIAVPAERRDGTPNPGVRLDPAPMLASVGTTVADGDIARAFSPTTPAEVGQRLRNLVDLGQPGRHAVWRRDRLARVPGALRIEGGELTDPANETALAWQRDNAEAVLAALCGPGEVNRDQVVNVNTARPIAAALAPGIAIGLGTHEFFRGLDLADLYGWAAAQSTSGTGLWVEADQAAVDPTSQATWKDILTVPACQTEMRIQAYFLTRALRVAITDQISRPRFVENVEVLMEALLARQAESALLETFDAWSIDRTEANESGYGAANHLFHTVVKALTWAKDIARVDNGSYTLIIPEALLNVARIDNYHAGVEPGQITARIQDALADFNVNLLVTPDWGAEGSSLPVLPATRFPGAGADANAGTALPVLPTSYVIRLQPLDDFEWGSVGVVDYGADTSADLKRMNQVQMFGETAEICYKRGARPGFTLTVSGVIPNGARADRVAPFTNVGGQARAAAAVPTLPAGFPAGQSI